MSNVIKRVRTEEEIQELKNYLNPIVSLKSNAVNAMKLFMNINHLS